MKSYQLFATAPKAMDAILAQEIEGLGGLTIKPTLAGVAFSGSLEIAYRACLWSRCANRILVMIDSFQVRNQDDLYNGIKKTNWFEHIAPTSSIAVSFSAKNSKAINNTHFGALKVKDAIVDQMRAKFNKRPDIDTDQPDLRINVYLQGETAQLSIDLSGESLHRRGYRDTQVPAPLKENLAAAMLIRSGWPEIAKQQGTLLDPMCGSGTLLLEGALIAADYAPGLLREYFGFLGWKKHDTALWDQLKDEAKQRQQEGLKMMPVIVGFDQHKRAVNAANQHIERAGLQDKIHIERRELNLSKPAESWSPGLVICNPPYGERLGDKQQVVLLYQQYGEVLKQYFIGWQAAMIISDAEFGFRLGIRSQKPVTLYNGALECKLLRMHIQESAFFIPKAITRQQQIEHISNTNKKNQEISSGAKMFNNRLSKNLKQKSKWAKRKQINCYRLYDADLPEYALAIDVYHCDLVRVYVQEYQAPKSIDTKKADTRLAEALAEIPKVLSIDPKQVYFKVKRQQKSTDPYLKLANDPQFYIVQEGCCQFYVNFEDYQDSGLALDHRPIRSMIQQQSKGKRFLDLFANTGSASVHAAVGGALSTTSVDISSAYLDWTQRNLQLNKVAATHQSIQADCRIWLAKEIAGKQRGYDLINLNPPAFSNSRQLRQKFDLQQEHVDLVCQAMKLLKPGGTLYFSNHFKRFKLDQEQLSQFQFEDISATTIPEDFSRQPKVHYCWRFQA